MESLFWLLKTRQSNKETMTKKDKKITNEDVLRAYMTYYNSSTLEAVHVAIRNYIGDEEVLDLHVTRVGCSHPA